MKFYIELTGNSNFRLQLDQSWRLVEDNAPLAESDFLTSDAIEVIRLQELNTELRLNNETWKINPDFRSIYGDDLTYRILVMRESYPQLPSREQLQSVIKQGDQRVSNCFILNVYGFYELRDYLTLNLDIKDPTVVCYNPEMDKEEGLSYVGKTAASHERHIESLYLYSLELWLKHLKTGSTSMWMDFSSDISLEGVNAEINNFREEFLSA